jgi:predicted alpha-1,6-mannanase (GH76 family)
MSTLNNTQYRSYADAAITALQAWYDPTTALYTGVTWWHSAICLDAVIDYTTRTGNSTYASIISAIFEKYKDTKFLQNSYDDMAWWALAWVNAYDLTGETNYLEMAKTIFSAMTGGWDNVCGGGVWWNFDRNYKNAIPNELFLSLATRLFQRTPAEQSYLMWALREWNWFQQSGMINASHLINDGLNNCQNNGGPTWTYNQGVILSGLADLYRITGEDSYLNQATAIADAVLNLLVTSEGILIESCEAAEPTGCDSNGAQFKGIFMHNLHHLYQTCPKESYRAFITRNVDSLWTRARNTNYQIGVHWSGPFDSADASRQSSALHAINAALSLRE